MTDLLAALLLSVAGLGFALVLAGWTGWRTLKGGSLDV